MPASGGSSMLEFLIPLASVVYIILFVIAFLRINRGRFEREIAQERSIRITQTPDSPTLEGNTRERSAALTR
jgi:hypothetical protein